MPAEATALRKAGAALLTSALAMMLTFPAPLGAEVVHGGEQGFTVRHTVTTEAEPELVYRTMTAHIDQWWNPEHSWTGKATNLHVKAERGGCFCERLAWE